MLGVLSFDLTIIGKETKKQCVALECNAKQMNVGNYNFILINNAPKFYLKTDDEECNVKLSNFRFYNNNLYYYVDSCNIDKIIIKEIVDYDKISNVGYAFNFQFNNTMNTYDNGIMRHSILFNKQTNKYEYNNKWLSHEWDVLFHSVVLGCRDV